MVRRYGISGGLKLSRKAFLRRWHSRGNLNAKKEQIVQRSAGKGPWSGVTRVPLKWEHDDKGKRCDSRRPGFSFKCNGDSSEVVYRKCIQISIIGFVFLKDHDMCDKWTVQEQECMPKDWVNAVGGAQERRDGSLSRGDSGNWEIRWSWSSEADVKIRQWILLWKSLCGKQKGGSMKARRALQGPRKSVPSTRLSERELDCHEV